MGMNGATRLNYSLYLMMFHFYQDLYLYLRISITMNVLMRADITVFNIEQIYLLLTKISRKQQLKKTTCQIYMNNYG